MTGISHEQLQAEVPTQWPHPEKSYELRVRNYELESSTPNSSLLTPNASTPLMDALDLRHITQRD